MIAFDSTLGSPTANSYVSVADADGLMPMITSKARSDVWLAIGGGDKEVHLMRAARLLETYIDFDGSRVSEYQPIAWPRYWVYGPDRCIAYSSDELPTQVGEAQALLALNLSEGFDQDEASSSPIEALKISSLSIKFVQDRAARGAMLLPAEVVEKLRGFGDYIGSTGMARSVPLVRY